jgi:anti-anti-sigma factor
MLSVSVDTLNGIIILRCAGRIVRGDETAILCSAARHHGSNIIVDLRDVVAIDAAGIGALVSLQAAGVYVKLANPNEKVREIFRVTKLDSIFEISDSQPSVEATNESAPGAQSIQGTHPSVAQ